MPWAWSQRFGPQLLPNFCPSWSGAGASGAERAGFRIGDAAVFETVGWGPKKTGPWYVYEARTRTDFSSASSDRLTPLTKTSRSGQMSRSATTVMLNWPA
jgi:hypothetical protein